MSFPGPPSILIEVCVDSLESALTAYANGADRLEVCANLPVGGGTTPSSGMVRCILDRVELPIMVLIRCRTGDFVYTPEELEVMRSDIEAIGELAASGPGKDVGVVIGALTAEGKIDEPAVRSLVQAARGMQVTFHRAFDMVRDAEEALTTLASIPGIQRILTSGLAATCIAGLSLITQLSIAHPNSLTLMPGSGVNAHTITPLLQSLYPIWHDQDKRGEVHLSAGRWAEPRKTFRRERMGFGLGVMGGEEMERREWGRWEVNGRELDLVRGLVDEFVGDFQEIR